MANPFGGATGEQTGTWLNNYFAWLRDNGWGNARMVTAPSDPDLLLWLNQNPNIKYMRLGNSYTYVIEGEFTTPGGSNSPGGAGGGGGGGGGSGGGTSPASINHLAALYGITFTSAEFGLVNNYVQKGGTLDEIAARLEALRYVDDNKTAFDQFEQTLRDRKLIGANKTLGFQERLDMALRAAPKQWLDIWEEAAARTSAAYAGFEIGKGKGWLDLTRQQVMGVTDKLPGRQEVTDTLAGFQMAANLALQIGPFSKYQNYHLSKDDLINAGNNIASAEVQNNITKMVNEVDAFQQLRAHPQFQTRTRGLAGQQAL